MIVRFGFVLCLCAAACAALKLDDDNDSADAPYLDIDDPDNGYHGLIRENETLVEVTPPIRAIGKVCSFVILNNKHHGEAPFEVRVLNDNEATLHVKYPLNCEKRKNYKFEIAAVGCVGGFQDKATVHVTVVDVNEYAPVFVEPSYVREVDEGRLYNEIVRVEANDNDCSPKFGDICKYEILNQDQPFAIDNEGVIRNTELLDFERSHNHILSVVAYDCGMKASGPVMVTIKVAKPCQAGWKGIAERVDYAAGSGALALFPDATLAACSSDARCPSVTRIRAAVTLRARHDASGCDRETFSLHDQRRMCGTSEEAVDLLPNPGVNNEWTSPLKVSVEGSESTYEFDGATTAAVVPEPLLNHSLAGTFSVSTWMRHEPRPDADKHTKEHILCLADDHKMNRHHYALFVRNCRLIFLLRRDFGDGDLNIFRPAEWRWKLPEVCDNEWHHYSLHVRFPNVELFVDGEPFRTVDGTNPEVIDDWPLHPAKDINTKLTVGACWQGTEGKFKHYLKGGLAGLNVLLHSIEPAQKIKCVAQCREGLSLAPDLFLAAVSVEGDSPSDVETLLRRVTYTNAHKLPTPGRRNVHIDTTITCDNGHTLKSAPTESYVMVQAPQTPTVQLSGDGDTARDYTSFRKGVPVFAHLAIKMSSNIAPESNHLDSCVASVYPALNPDHEALMLRQDEEFAARTALTRDGVTITGSDSVAHYEQILRNIVYTNKKPAYYLNRVFKLTCSELNGRFSSNEYVQTLTVIHPHTDDSHPRNDLHSGIADKLDNTPRDQVTNNNEHSNEIPRTHWQPGRTYAAHAMRSPPHIADQQEPKVTHESESTNHIGIILGVLGAGVALVCAGVAGARLPRRAQTARAPTDAEMAWDDSALNITVNPMDDTNVEAAPNDAADSSDGESCSDSDSEQRDSSDEDDEVISHKQHKYKNINQLEWDNSTM